MKIGPNDLDKLDLRPKKLDFFETKITVLGIFRIISRLPAVRVLGLCGFGDANNARGNQMSLFTRLFAVRQTQPVATVSRVRKLDGQFIIILNYLPGDMIEYVYEGDRTNTRYQTLEAFCN